MEETEAGRGGWSLRRLEAATGDGGDRGWKRWLELEAAGGSDWRWRRQRLEELEAGVFELAPGSETFS